MPKYLTLGAYVGGIVETTLRYYLRRIRQLELKYVCFGVLNKFVLTTSLAPSNSQGSSKVSGMLGLSSGFFYKHRLRND